VFCPLSIYFHGLYEDINKIVFQREAQLSGTKAHESIDKDFYSTKTSVMCGTEVYSQKYNLIGKIDIYDRDTKTLTERKNKISKFYDGYVFQLYAEYFCLTEMGFVVDTIRFYSMKDNKVYKTKKPEENKKMLEKFEQLIYDIHHFNMDKYMPNNQEKCKNCIYEPMCFKSVVKC
jgi:CRISPR-associated protein Cas4